MNFLLLPDFIAITLLVTVLLLVRSKRSDSVIRMWTVGLLLILLECAARIVYEMRLPRPYHLLSHAIALDAYGLAGATFLLSASRVLRRMSGRTVFMASNVLPHLALFTVYGFDVKSAWIYRGIVLAGVAVGFGSCALLRRPWQFYAAFAVVWTPLLICTNVQQYRYSIYLSLFFLYALSAIFFFNSLRRGSRGKILVVAGFSMWAVCFATHPWVSTAHPQWTEFVAELWTMQKFVITIGLLLVMLEDQIRSNEWLALHDALTGLPNRRLFEDRLQHALSYADRAKTRLALFNVDLDGFKQINDTFGHDAGDFVLKEVSHTLLRSLRRSDTLARLGGDEFTLIAADLDGAAGHRLGCSADTGFQCAASQMPQVQRILATMMQAVEQPIVLEAEQGGQTVAVSASIGVAIYPDEASSAEDLIRIADKRMYMSKDERGRTHKKRRDDPHTELDLQRV